MLLVSPQRWKVIKLTGRAIEFDETGIVSAMSKVYHHCRHNYYVIIIIIEFAKVESDVPSLNISTANTNCTLVPEVSDSLLLLFIIIAIVIVIIILLFRNSFKTVYIIYHLP